MISVIYRHESECRIYNDGERWFYGATWMPIDMEYVINVSEISLHMMLDEKAEAPEPVDHKYGPGTARRYYRNAVEDDLHLSGAVWAKEER